MNRTLDVELVLRDYFADDGGAAPDDVLDVVEQRIGRQPQRRAWRLQGRFFMNGYTKLVAAAAAVLIVGFVGWQLLPGLPGQGGNPTPVPTSLEPTPTPASAGPPTPGPSCEDGIPGCTGALPAGEHTTVGFAPVFTFSTAAGWNNTVASGSLYTLWPSDSLFRVPADLIMVWSDAVPADRGADCITVAKGGSGRSVADWMAYLENHPGLNVTDARAVNLNGSTGQVVDLQIRNLGRPLCEDDAPSRSHPLIKLPDGEPGDGYGIAIGTRIRFYAIGVGNQTVLITTYVYDSESDGEYAATTEFAQRVIDTFDWACDADAPPGPCWGPPDGSGNPATPPPGG